MYISKRLETVVSFVEACDTVADIGCDHGFTLIYLCMQNIIKRGIACDINKLPLSKAIHNIRKYGYDERIETRLSDGLSAIMPNEAEAIVVSGMGGMLMIRILKESEQVVKTVNQLVLQPQQDLCAVRKYVHEIGYEIVNEGMVYDDEKYYNILNCKKGVENGYSEVDYLLGKKLIERKDTILKSFLLKETEKLERIIKNLDETPTKSTATRAIELQVKNKMYKEVLRCL